MFCRLAFLMLSLLFMSSSGALALECERYKLAQTGFTTPAAAESWYPKFMSFNNLDFEPKGGSSKNMIFEDKNWTDSKGNQTSVKYSLMKNGKLIARVDFAPGYQDPDDSRYRCDMTSIELKEANASETAKSNTPSAQSNSETIELPDGIPEEYSELRRVTFVLSTGKIKTMGAGKIEATTEGFVTEGLVVLNEELCTTTANFINDTKEGTFEIICPDGFSMSGGYVPLGEDKGSIGRGYDNNNQPVEYRLHSNIGSNFVSVVEFNKFYLSKVSTSSLSSDIGKAKKTCEELGFTPKTEKFADCVIKLM